MFTKAAANYDGWYGMSSECQILDDNIKITCFALYC